MCDGRETRCLYIVVLIEVYRFSLFVRDVSRKGLRNTDIAEVYRACDNVCQTQKYYVPNKKKNKKILKVF